MTVAAQLDPPENLQASVSTPLQAHMARAIVEAGGWLPFDQYMALALYTPGLGYYSAGAQQIGRLPAGAPVAAGRGSDFVTAPHISPLFGQALAVQVAQALQATGTDQIVEFGAGSGVLAAQLLEALPALGQAHVRYAIVELSAALRARQMATLAAYGERVQWLDRLPAALSAVVVGNEVLDAMPVQLLHFDGTEWFERGVVLTRAGGLAWGDRPTPLRPPVEDGLQGGTARGTVTEIHRQAQAFIGTLARTLQRGAAFFIDYGFPQAEYYHPQRVGGTLMCHRGHRADTDPLVHVGEKDITAHVDFTAIALAGQDAGLHVLGYTSQAHFLMNCGVMDLLAQADLPQRAMAQKLLTEHEMGELFKVVGFAAGTPFRAVGFARGDRSHTL